jgi:hypothetical protein
MATHAADAAPTFVNPKDKFWSLYLEGADAEDKARVENWKGDTDGILIFVRDRFAYYHKLV